MRGHMLLTQNWLKVGKYVIWTIFIISLLVNCYFILPPLWGNGGADELADIESVRIELSEANRINESLMGEVNSLGESVEEREGYIMELEATIEAGLHNYLEHGDIIIEAAIIADESFFLIRELRKRLD